MALIAVAAAVCLPDRWPLGPGAVLGASVTVNSTTDVADGDTSSIANLIANPGADGVISLREAMQAANNSGGSDTINFNIPGSGVRTITITSGLPGMNQPAVIDGSTQPGFAGSPLIELNGNGTGGDGLVFLGGNSTVRSLIINRFGGNGIIFQNTGNNVIAGNYIGTNSAGTAAQPNGQNGLMILGPPANTIGGLTPADRNVISGNTQNGIVLQNSSATDNLIQGNFIGTNAAGTAGIGNGANGIRIDAPGETVGGGQAGARNVISGNKEAGVLLINSGSTNNRVQGNFIGTDVNGAGAIPNDFGVVVGDIPNLKGVSNGFIGTDGDGINDATEGNLISGNLVDGILLTLGGTTNNRVAGNLIGTNAAGTAAVANGGSGIVLSQAASSNAIGTNRDGISDDLEKNLISGNGVDGVSIIGSGTQTNGVRGNLIGTNAAGTAAIPNLQNGVQITAATNTIGGITDVERNTISGNIMNGVLISGSGATGNQVRGNRIGTGVAGTGDVGNGGAGVRVDAGANANIIGNAGGGNTIAFNGQGVVVGASAADTSTIRNRISQNSIFQNDGLGIDLGANGVTPNDAGDGDNGPNIFLNFPVVTDARQSASTVIQFTFNSTANTQFTIEFFSSVTADPSAHGEGQTFLGTTTVTTNGAGNFSGSFTAAATVPAGQVITATATDPNGNTSEFSATRVVLTPTYAKFSKATALRFGDDVLLSWRTSLEIDNLGFNVYREEKAGKTQLTKQLVAGSALFAGSGTVLTAGRGYNWVDRQARDDAVYWIEAIDLDGLASLIGPISPRAAFGRLRAESSHLLGQTDPDQPSNSTLRAYPTQDDRARAARLQLGGATTSAFNPSSPAVKISVNRDGWYRVTQAQLVAAGLDPSVDPRFLQLFADGLEVPVRVSSDNPQLGPSDTLEFYGKALDTPTTGTQVYYLVSGAAPGKRIPLVGAKRGDEALAETFSCVIEREDNLLYFTSALNGDTENIFGPIISVTEVSQTLTLPAPDQVPAVLEVAVQGVSTLSHSIRVLVNGSVVGNIDFSGREHRIASMPLPASALQDGSNVVSLVGLNSSADVSLLDYLRVTYQRRYRAVENSLFFSVPALRGAHVTGFTTDRVRLFDLTDPGSPTELDIEATPDSAGGFAIVVPSTAGSRNMLVVADADAGSPIRVEQKRASDWRSPLHRADLLIVTHPVFREAADRLAKHRAGQGLFVEVAEVNDIFDEFGHGSHSPQALKDFFAWAASNWKRPPRYVLLMGDSSWDPRDYFGRALDFIPTKLIDTQLMETASDDWLADFNDDGLPELAVGRLPVKSGLQADLVVSKLISFDGSLSRSQALDALLVADTGFESINSRLRALLPANMPVQEINRSSGPSDAAIRSGILTALNRGTAIVSYAGHGSVGVWTGAGLLRTEDAGSLTNGTRMPLMVLLTCLNSYSHDIFVDSLGEAMLLQPAAGAIAVWGPTAMTTPQAQEEIARAFYGSIFSNSKRRLGDAIVAAKAATPNTDVRRSWILLGDPASRIR